jgi:hypothetical protein
LAYHCFRANDFLFHRGWSTARSGNSWLKRFYSSNEPNVQFRDAPEILPEWNLRLNVQADGKGYVLLLNDASDKTGFAWVSDESGIIRECKYL